MVKHCIGFHISTTIEEDGQNRGMSVLDVTAFRDSDYPEGFNNRSYNHISMSSLKRAMRAIEKMNTEMPDWRMLKS